MATQPLPADAPEHSEDVVQQNRPKKARMSTRQRFLFFFTAWLLVLMPFLFWWGTWFGRPLSAKDMTEYINDNNHPRHIQHALVQLGQRMTQHDGSASQWYNDLLRLASNPREEVRSTDAWVMGQDTAFLPFHEALLKMLDDPSLVVRGNAALSLVRFGDASGRPVIVSLLQPVTINATTPGKVVDVSTAGTAIHENGLVAKVKTPDGRTQELRSPISGRLSAISVATGANLSPGAKVATVAPEDGQVWEALRALYLIGQSDDLPAIRSYERSLPEISERVRVQAINTERVIQERAGKQ